MHRTWIVDFTVKPSQKWYRISVAFFGITQRQVQRNRYSISFKGVQSETLVL